jgi:uncharacterized membrane protein
MRFRQHSKLAETLSFGVIHLVLAVLIGWLLSGTFVFGAMLALLEPLCNTVVSHGIGKLFPSRAGTRPAVLKSAVIGVAHLVVAVGLTRMLTGSFAAAWAYALIEPAANAVAHYYFERWWHRPPAPTASAPHAVAAA